MDILCNDFAEIFSIYFPLSSERIVSFHIEFSGKFVVKSLYTKNR